MPQLAEARIVHPIHKGYIAALLGKLFEDVLLRRPERMLQKGELLRLDALPLQDLGRVRHKESANVPRGIVEKIVARGEVQRDRCSVAVAC